MHCTEECGKALKEPMPYGVFRKYCKVLDKEQCLRGYSMTFSIKISPGASFSSRMYQSKNFQVSSDSL